MIHVGGPSIPVHKAIVMRVFAVYGSCNLLAFVGTLPPPHRLADVSPVYGELIALRLFVIDYQGLPQPLNL